MFKLVIIRHGESVWNKQNLFTGWTDVGLSKEGEREAREAGKILKEKGFVFDVAFTSVLKRSTQTLDIVLSEMKMNIPVQSSWRLNERHYGALQGVNKKEMVKKHGFEQVFTWRRSYAVRPPALSEGEPKTESLKDTWERILPFWEETIVPTVRSGKRVLISAHGSTSRALIKHLEGISDKDIEEINVPTGIPLVYELDEELKPIKHYYLGDEKEIEGAIKEVQKEIS